MDDHAALLALEIGELYGRDIARQTPTIIADLTAEGWTPDEIASGMEGVGKFIERRALVDAEAAIRICIAESNRPPDQPAWPSAIPMRSRR